MALARESQHPPSSSQYPNRSRVAIVSSDQVKHGCVGRASKHRRLPTALALLFTLLLIYFGVAGNRDESRTKRGSCGSIQFIKRYSTVFFHACSYVLCRVLQPQPCLCRLVIVAGISGSSTQKYLAAALMPGMPLEMARAILYKRGKSQAGLNGNSWSSVVGQELVA